MSHNKKYSPQVLDKGPQTAPVSPDKQDELALAAYYYVKSNEFCLSLDEYFLQHNYNVRAAKKMAETNEYVRDLYAQAKAHIALRIEELWREKKISDSYAQTMLSLNSPSHLGLRKLFAHVKPEDVGGAKNVNIIMQDLRGASVVNRVDKNSVPIALEE